MLSSKRALIFQLFSILNSNLHNIDNWNTDQRRCIVQQKHTDLMDSATEQKHYMATDLRHVWAKLFMDDLFFKTSNNIKWCRKFPVWKWRLRKNDYPVRNNNSWQRLNLYVCRYFGPNHTPSPRMKPNILCFFVVLLVYFLHYSSLRLLYPTKEYVWTIVNQRL
jgi:hypothetical protein